MRQLAALGVAITVLASSAAPPGGEGAAGGPLLIANPAVQAELKLTDAQKAKARGFAVAHETKLKAAQDEADLAKADAEVEKLTAAGMTAVAAFLTADQATRLRQVHWQLAGLHALAADDDLRKSLKLTDAQTQSLARLADELSEGLTELGQRGPTPDSRTKAATLRKQFTEKGVAVLTEAQRKAYRELLGKPFEPPADRK